MWRSNSLSDFALGLTLVAVFLSISAEDIPGIPKTDLHAIRERTYLSDTESEIAKKDDRDVVGKFWIILTKTDPVPSSPSTNASTTSASSATDDLSSNSTSNGTSNANNLTNSANVTSSNTTTEAPTTTAEATTTTTTINGTISGNGSSLNSTNSTDILPFPDIDRLVKEAMIPDQKIRSQFCRISKAASNTYQYCSYLLYGHDFAGFWRSLRESLAKKNWNIDNYNMETYVKVKKNTVFQTYMVLYDTKYMPQFNDLNNSATLKISNDLMLLTRPMLKNRFGEFFFRTVVLGYYEDPLTSFVIANMAFLVEPGERNFMDFYGAWINQRDNSQSLGSYRLENGDFRTYHIEYIPTKFDQFLILKDSDSRAARTLDTLANLTEVGIPSLIVLAIIILVIVICAWEGWCCKRFIENDPK